MKYNFFILLFLVSINTFGQDNCYKIEGLKDQTKIVFKKEKVIVIEDKNHEDSGSVLVKVYFMGEPFIRIQRIKSGRTKELVTYDNPIYGIIYSKLVEYFDKHVCVQYEENLIYDMTYVFEYRIAK